MQRQQQASSTLEFVGPARQSSGAPSFSTLRACPREGKQFHPLCRISIAKNDDGCAWVSDLVESAAHKGGWKMKTIPLLAILLLVSMTGCHPSTLKTIDLPPTSFQSGVDGFALAQGYCISTPNTPASSFTQGTGELLVGFDDFYKPGAPPAPCDTFRVSVFRGGLLFDVSQFDSIVSANLLFDTSRSVVRTGGQKVDGATSVATVLGAGTAAFTGPMPDTNETSLTPGSTSVNVGVSPQVRAWITHAQPNFGFVIGGPHFVDKTNPPKDNDASVSFYTNIRLQILYNTGQNPRAPQ